MTRTSHDPDGEVYTIGQVAELTGVPENTIRSWERRHGVPSPKRGSNHQRRYTRSDVNLITGIQAERLRGRAMDQAIWNASRTPNGDPDEARRKPDRVVSTSLPSLCDRLVHVLLKVDLTAANDLLAQATWTHGPGPAALEMLYPASLQIENLQIQGDTPFHVARVGHAWIQRKLLSCLELTSPELGTARILVAGLHDDSATLHGTALACVLSSAGYSVLWAGGGQPAAGIDDLIVAQVPDAAVLVAGSAPGRLALAGVKARIEHVMSRQGWNGIVMLAGVETETIPHGIMAEAPAARVVNAIRAALDGVAREMTTREPE